ncbi:hypothetical protein E3P77_02565 [Wallemia ichthyophaga]|nr:hypothetical protein E3P77_02565 [Wallemia ichthyophaga]
MAHARNTSTHSHSHSHSLSHIMRENSLPEEPIGLAADRIDEGAGNAQTRPGDDFRLAGAFDIPPVYEERHGRSHSRANSGAHAEGHRRRSCSHGHARSRSRHAYERDLERGQEVQQQQDQTPEQNTQNTQNTHSHNTTRNTPSTQQTTKHLPELSYHPHKARPQIPNRASSNERRRSQPIGLGSDRINEGGDATDNKVAGHTYSFSTDGGK